LLVHLREFGERILSCGIGHPRKREETIVERRANVIDHLLRRGLGCWRERPVDVRLAQRLTDLAIGGTEAALPAREHLLRAAVERRVGKALVREWRAEPWRCTGDEMVAEIRAPFFHWSGLDESARLLNELRLRDVDELHRNGESDGPEIARPLDCGRCTLEIRERRLVIGRVWIA